MKISMRDKCSGLAPEVFQELPTLDLSTVIRQVIRHNRQTFSQDDVGLQFDGTPEEVLMLMQWIDEGKLTTTKSREREQESASPEEPVAKPRPEAKG